MKTMTRVNRETYSKRAELATNPTARKLFRLMDEKKTNLAVAADVTSKSRLLVLADQLGPHICVFKTHIDILDEFNDGFVRELQALSDKHNFLIFEDRKFADIGNTVKHQYENGIYKISQWAHITNAHALPGPGLVKGLREGGLPLGRGLLLIAEMSSENSLIDNAYKEATVNMAHDFSDFVMGFISQKKMTNNPAFIHMTPGVNLGDSGDKLGQQYNTPEHVIGTNGSDVIIVGRGIIQAKDPVGEALRYKEAGWKAAFG